MMAISWWCGRPQEGDPLPSKCAQEPTNLVSGRNAIMVCLRPLSRDMLRSCKESSYRELVQISLQRSCQETSYRNFYANLANGPFVEILKRSCREVFFRERLQISCQEASCKDLTLHRDLVKKTDLAKRSYRELEQREILLSDLLQRLSAGILCRHLAGMTLQSFYSVQITCQGDLAQSGTRISVQIFLQGVCRI